MEEDCGVDVICRVKVKAPTNDRREPAAEVKRRGAICRRPRGLGATGFVVVCLAVPALAIKVDPAEASRAGDFYIISSVDARKHQLVLKLPTEVTELMLVTSATSCQDQSGRPIDFTSLRAGDTVYIVSRRDGDGTFVALQIRKGPMTLDELHRRYLKGLTNDE